MTHQGEDRISQRARLLKAFIHAKGRDLSLPDILALKISQYGARIYELRKLGFHIVNRVEHVEGQTRSWFRLENAQQQLQLIELPETPPDYPD